ncbi:MAG: HAD family hydrolase [Clostridiales bacterium]|nr:HAD family hydrolase [Clostridiales bacterium]
MKKAAFFDRDGTVIIDKGYLYNIEDIEFIEGVPELIKFYNENNYLVIIITNQSGIARGMFTIYEMEKVHEEINRLLKLKYNAHIDAFYYCPHHPLITGECECRKPSSGMLNDAIRDFGLDVSQSILFGDKESDIKCGENIGVASYYIQSVLGLVERSQWDIT